MTRARDEPDPEALEVVVRVAEGVDLELAAVARARVDLADGQGAARSARISAWISQARVRSRSSATGGGSEMIPVFRILSVMGSISSPLPSSSG